MRQQAAAFAEHAPLAREVSDPEQVHQTRVATRRMRAALRLFGDVLPAEQIAGLDDELKWVAGLLGPVRDLDVQVRRLHDVGVELRVSDMLVPYGAWLEEQRQRALVSLNDAFRSQRFVELTRRLGDLDDLAPGPQGDQPLDADAPRRLKRTFRKLRKCADELAPDSPAPAFHRARICAKRLRYAAEFVEPWYAKPARRLIKATVALQDLLGQHQDAIVSTQRIHEAVQTAGGAWPAETSLALGRVVQHEAAYGKKLRRGFRSTYREVEAAWARLQRAL
jgi:CHAD domain-containing protein